MTGGPPARERLEITAEDQAGVRVVHVRGSGGMDQSQLLTDRLNEEVTASPRLVLDLHELTFISSSGLAVLIQLHRRCQEEGRAFALAAPRDSIRQVLRITQLDRLLEIHPDIEQAIAAVGGAQGQA